jgi:hypothetical protein
MALSEKSSRQKSAPSKKRKLTPESEDDNDQANARAHYTSSGRLGNSIQNFSCHSQLAPYVGRSRRFRVVTICASGPALRGRISE